MKYRNRSKLKNRMKFSVRNKVKKNNPKIFHETREQEIQRLIREENKKLDNAVVRRSQTMLWEKGIPVYEQ